MRIHLTNKYDLIFLLGLVFTVGYLLRHFLYSDTIFYVHDNLDSNFVFFKVLGESGKLFASNATVIPEIMNGLPRASYPNELNILTLLYSIFEPSTGYVFNEVATRLVAYLGMYFLLTSYVFNNKDSLNRLMAMGMSIAFALLPFYPWAGLSVAGQPLALYSFLNLKRNVDRLSDWIIIALMPFYSSLILSGLFFLFLVACLFLYDGWNRKKINYPFLFSILMMSGAYVIAEYRLVLSMFSKVFISHRLEFVTEPLNFSALIERSKEMLLSGQYHAHSLHTFFILPFALIVFLTSIFPTKYRSYFTALVVGFVTLMLGLNTVKVFDWNRFIELHLLYESPFYFCALFLLMTAVFLFKRIYHEGFISLALLVIACWYGLWQGEFLHLIKKVFPIIKQIQLDRFYFLNALLWFLLFAYLAKRAQECQKYSVVLIFAFILSQVIYSFKMNAGEQWRQPTSLEDFYLPELFSQAKQFIGKPVDQYKVASIGFEPLIAAYNGFYTLDGYCSNYPLAYKHEFRKIIEEELAKNENCKKYFDDWGSRCYLFYCQEILDGKVIPNLSLNLKQFTKMGGEFIFSKYIIQNEKKENRLTLVKEFSNGSQILYLYQVQ